VWDQCIWIEYASRMLFGYEQQWSYDTKVAVTMAMITMGVLSLMVPLCMAIDDLMGWQFIQWLVYKPTDELEAYVLTRTKSGTLVVNHLEGSRTEESEVDIFELSQMKLSETEESMITCNMERMATDSFIGEPVVDETLLS